MHIAIIMTIIMMEAVATTTSIMMVSVGMIIATATENAMRLRFPGDDYFSLVSGKSCAGNYCMEFSLQPLPNSVTLKNL